MCEALNGRTLTSAWIETWERALDQQKVEVALSRVRGLKLWWPTVKTPWNVSHSHECVD